MSIHKECGETIKWAHRDDNAERFMPPLEYIGEVYIIGSDGVAVQMHGYKIHNCDPDKIVAWQDYQQRLAEVRGETFSPYEAVRERDRELVWDGALRVACEVCDARRKEKCRSMARKHRISGEIVYIRNPHTPRVEKAREKGFFV